MKKTAENTKSAEEEKREKKFNNSDTNGKEKKTLHCNASTLPIPNAQCPMPNSQLPIPYCQIHF
ncbi:MAG: hypothetical protein AAF630_01120 [Cyanobacteria bacterium P01_C01_bin.38]